MFFFFEKNMLESNNKVVYSISINLSNEKASY